MAKLVSFSDEDFQDLICTLNFYKQFYKATKPLLSPEDLEGYDNVVKRIDQILQNISNSSSVTKSIFQRVFNEGFRQGELRGVEDIICLRGFGRKTDNHSSITRVYKGKKNG